MYELIKQIGLLIYIIKRDFKQW